MEAATGVTLSDTFLAGAQASVGYSDIEQPFSMKALLAAEALPLLLPRTLSRQNEH